MTTEPESIAPEPAESQRFPILISPLWRPLLLPFGATADRSYAEIEDGELHVRFGLLFDHRFPLDQVEEVNLSHWPIWAGVGWRTSFRGTIGLIGTYVNIVELRFAEPQRVRMILPMPCRRLVLSVQEPRDFLDALGKRERAGTAALRRRRAAKVV